MCSDLPADFVIYIYTSRIPIIINKRSHALQEYRHCSWVRKCLRVYILYLPMYWRSRPWKEGPRASGGSRLPRGAANLELPHSCFLVKIIAEYIQHIAKNTIYGLLIATEAMESANAKAPRCLYSIHRSLSHTK